MKLHVVCIFIFIFVSKVNAMHLLDKNNLKNLKENWEFVSDKVMGGLSSGKIELVSESDKIFVRLSGNVSTENNGGFIQFRSNFDFKNEDYQGIRIIAKGFPSEYFVHIRTKFLLLPWQYYKGKFEVSEQWQKYEILFDDFEKSNFYQPSNFRTQEINSIGFVAIGKDFKPILDIIEVELF